MPKDSFSISVSRGARLACFLATPKAKSFPLLIAIHGFASSHESVKIQYLSDQLPKKGWGVLSFDLRGHGISPGNLEDITVDKSVKDVRAVLRYAQSMEGIESISAFGSSYGGLLAIILAIEMPELALLGLCAPVTDFVGQYGLAHSKAGLAKWKKDGFFPYTAQDGTVRKIRFDFYLSMLTYHEHLLGLAPKIVSPTFIVQGEADEQVPISLTYKFFESLHCEKDFVAVPGADHRFTNQLQRANMLKRFVQFYSENV